MLNRPHPGPLPQERETHSPLTGHIGVLGCRAPSETNGKEAATATATNKLSGSIGSFPLPLNRTECARPRAQKDAMVRRHQNIPKLSLLLTLLRPGTGALRFRGSKRKNAFRRILSLGERVRVRASVNTFLALLLAGVLWCFGSASLQAQNHSIDWFTMDGGGGTSTGGVYSVSGTIGQPDANAPPLTGGNFSLIGGFWSLLAVQTPGAPLLTIRLTSANTALVLWPSPSTGFTLQQNTDLNTANWVAASETVSDNGTNRFILVNPPTGNRFYRLFKP